MNHNVDRVTRPKRTANSLAKAAHAQDLKLPPFTRIDDDAWGAMEEFDRERMGVASKE